MNRNDSRRFETLFAKAARPVAAAFLLVCGLAVAGGVASGAVAASPWLGLSCVLVLCGLAPLAVLTRDALHAQARAAASGASPTASPATPSQAAASQHADKPAERSATPFDVELAVASVEPDPEPFARLKALVEDVRLREARADGLFVAEDGAPAEAPAPLELYLAQELEDAGLFELPSDLPGSVRLKSRTSCATVLSPRATGDAGLSLALLRVEAALNRALFAQRHYDSAGSATLEGFYRFNDRLEASIAAQVSSLRVVNGKGTRLAGADGEWDVRHAIALGIESLTVPYRLQADFRVNLARKVAAFELVALPRDAMARRAWCEPLGRVVETTGRMRARAATELACREALMMARIAFGVAPAVERAFVNVRGEDGCACVLSACLVRDVVMSLDMREPFDPVWTMDKLGARLEVEHGALRPVDALFSFVDEDLSPRWRVDAPERSARALGDDEARALGASRVKDLAINEPDRFGDFVDDVCGRLGPSTAENVSAISAAARAADAGYPYETDVCEQAARRVIGLLVDGALPDDPTAVREALLQSTGLDAALEESARAMRCLDGERVIELLEPYVSEAEAAGRYADGSDRRWRSFRTHVERGLFNRFFDDDKRPLRLVPPAYHAALLGLSTAYLQRGDYERALQHALRVTELDPLDTGGRLRAARCFEAMGDLPMARASLEELLAWATDPSAIGVGYHAMAHVLWLQGERDAAVACYQKCERAGIPVPKPAAGTRSKAPQSQGAQEQAGQAKAHGRGGSPRDHDALPLDDERALEMQELSTAPRLSLEQTNALLEAARVPVAPTKQVGDALLAGAKAAVDAEVFCVAREYNALVGLYSGDDAVRRITRSLGC